MSRGASPPLRFLALVLCGWVAIRAAAWIGWPERSAQEVMTASAPVMSPARGTANMSGVPAPAPPPVLLPPIARDQPSADMRYAARNAATHEGAAVAPGAGARLAGPLTVAPPALAPGPAAIAAFPLPAPTAGRRWSASAWLLARRDGAPPALAPAGLLGGSQAGARLLYWVNGSPARPLSIAARVSAPLQGRGAEAALGVDWRPHAGLPVNLLVERRKKLDGGGRSAFAAALYGSASLALPAAGRLDVYAQAGAVGLKERDLFADGAARIGLPLGPAEIGGGVWAAAQPGVARLDAGPQISLPLRSRAANLRLSADWRFRLAGDAAPGSGPALTLATDF